MRRFNILYFLTIATLMVPNVVLDITEGMSIWACIANILLPLGIYTLLMSISRKPGKMTWWLFPYIFFSAFSIDAHGQSSEWEVITKPSGASLT